jgi:hypothetical protein
MPTTTEQIEQVREQIGRIAVDVFWGNEEVNQYALQDLLRGKIPEIEDSALQAFRGGFNFGNESDSFSYGFTSKFSPGEDEKVETLRFVVEQSTFSRGQERPGETREFLIRPNGVVLRAVYEGMPVGSEPQRLSQLTEVADCLIACAEIQRSISNRVFPREPVAYIREVLAQFLEHEGKDKYWHGPVAAVSLLRGEAISDDYRPLRDTGVWVGLSYDDPLDPNHPVRTLSVKSEHGLPIGESGSQGPALVVSRRNQDTTRFGITPDGSLLDLIRTTESLEANEVRLGRDLSLLQQTHLARSK